MKDLKYVIVPGQWPQAEMQSQYETVYSCWEKIWDQAFRDLGKPEGYLKSDGFTRQDYTGAIFNNDQCIALNTFRTVDLSQRVFQRDSYFNNWSETHQAKLAAHGKKIIICSNLGVAPEARGMNLGVKIKDVLMGLIVQNLVHSSADALAGTPRQDRHVDESCLRWGAEEVAREIPSGYGDQVRLVVFYRDVVAHSPKQPLSPLVESLWENRIDAQYISQNKNKNKNKKNAA